ncbi:MAG TPA: DUF1569 domain-containing protein [Terriglobales bacterium]|nr:DUF1569 domain-containing protein [Terriglobales bacterium]
MRDKGLSGGLRRLEVAIADATRGMSAEQLKWHPPGKWCAAEVLEHLYLTYHGTVKGCERCLQEGRPLARTPRLQDRIKTTVVVGLGYMPPGRKAPERSTPRGMEAVEVLKAIEAELAAMNLAITQCEERFGKATRILDHPILGPLTAQQWRQFHWVHGRHHLKQIWRLREHTAAR